MTIKRRWTAEEKKYMEQHYGTVPIKKIAKVLKRSLPAVQCQAQAQNLCKPIKKSKKIKIFTKPKNIDKTALVTLILVTILVIFNLILLIK